MNELIETIKSLSSRDFWDYFTIVTSFISVIILFFTFLLAWKINRKIDKPIIEKQLETVYQLINELQSVSIKFFKIEFSSNNTKYIGQTKKIKFFLIKNNFNEIEFKNLEIIMNVSNKENLKFLTYQDNPFIPSTISEALKMIKIDYNDKVDFLQQNKALVCLGDFDELAIPSTYPDNFIHFTNQRIKSFRDLLELFIQINDAIIKWVKNPKVELNLR